MEPMTMAVVAAGGAQAVSAIMQYYQAEKARKATEKRLGEIERMFDAIVPPDLDLKIWDDPAMVATIPMPALNLENLEPHEFKQLQQFVPEVAEYVREAAPQMVEASEAAKTGRNAQLETLEAYRKIAGDSFDPLLQSQLAETASRANAEAQSRQASILQDAARRGQVGSSQMLAAQMMGSGDAMARAGDQSRFAAAEAYRNRLRAMDQSATLGGNIRQSEMSEAGRNADIINNFNERTSKSYQNWANQRAESINAAKRYNIDQAQKIDDANVDNRNKFAVQNMERTNALAQQQYQNARTNREDKMNVALTKDKIKQQLYENLMNKAAHRAGMGYKANDYLMQSAADRNQIIGGLGNAATNIGMGYANYSTRPNYGAPPPPQQQQTAFVPNPNNNVDYWLDDEIGRTS